MASIRYPNPLAPGNTIGVTASSSPVHPDLRLRFEHCASVVRKLGFGVREGRCLMGDGIVSAIKVGLRDNVQKGQLLVQFA